MSVHLDYYAKQVCALSPKIFKRRNRKWLHSVLVGGLLLLLALFVLYSQAFSRYAFSVTGEEARFAQIKGMFDLLVSQFQPPLHLDEHRYTPIPHADVNPFGVNVFLEQEVEPAKREKTVRLAKAAGFYWLRQEFPWEDIEISAKGNFTDCRNPPCRSAWEKYDQIVSLAEKYHMELIVRLDNPPAWSRAQGNKIGTKAPPDNFTDFGDFVAAVVRRYKGRIHYYQIWNEPNIYPEWGKQPVNPEAYVRLLRVGYTRAKAVDPSVTIIAGALAANSELGPRNMSDTLFLQRMYDAGAAAYFDIMSMQGYGLWSGPTDRRLNPLVVNFSRPMLIRDIMVRNGDGNKPIWISEMNWNTAPLDVPAVYGRTTPDQQAYYLLLAYDRIQREWPWLGMAAVWYLRRPTDQWLKERRPEAYFQLLTPDFQETPAYRAIRAYSQQPPLVYRGVHDETHWALSWHGHWTEHADRTASLGHFWSSQTAGDTFSFSFWGNGADLVVCRGPQMGRMAILVDGRTKRALSLYAPKRQCDVRLPVARLLRDGSHFIRVTVPVLERPGQNSVAIDGVIVYGRRPWHGLDGNDYAFLAGVLLIFTLGYISKNS